MASCLCHVLFFSDGPAAAETTQGKQIPRCSRQKCKYFARGKINFKGEELLAPYTAPSREEVAQLLQALADAGPVTQPLQNDYRPMPQILNPSPIVPMPIAQPCCSSWAAPVMAIANSLPPSGSQQPLPPAGFNSASNQLMPPVQTTTLIEKLEGLQDGVGQALRAAQTLTKNLLALQSVFPALVTQVEDLTAQVEAERMAREGREMVEREWEREQAERAREKAKKEREDREEREKAEKEEKAAREKAEQEKAEARAREG